MRKPGTARALPAEARGIAHQLCEAFGSLDRTQATFLPTCARDARPQIVWREVRPACDIHPEIVAAGLRRPCWRCCGACGRASKHIPPPPTPGITSFDAEDGAAPDGFLRSGRLSRVGPRAIRWNAGPPGTGIGDRQPRRADRRCPFPKLVSLLGCERAKLDEILAALGWRRVAVTGEKQMTACGVVRSHVPDTGVAAVGAIAGAETSIRPTAFCRSGWPSSRGLTRWRADSHRQMAVACPLLQIPRSGAARGRPGLIRLNGTRVEKASAGVGPGDVLTLPERPRRRGRPRSGAGNSSRPRARSADALRNPQRKCA